MPNWNDVLQEVKATPTPYDIIRRKYLNLLHEHTNRCVIAYYSGWLQKQSLTSQGVSFSLDELDKGGFMTAISGLNRDAGLDLILQKSGGGWASPRDPSRHTDRRSRWNRRPAGSVDAGRN